MNQPPGPPRPDTTGNVPTWHPGRHRHIPTILGPHPPTEDELEDMFRPDTPSPDTPDSSNSAHNPQVTVVKQPHSPDHARNLARDLATQLRAKLDATNENPHQAAHNLTTWLLDGAGDTIADTLDTINNTQGHTP